MVALTTQASKAGVQPAFEKRCVSHPPPQGATHLPFLKGVARIDPATFEVKLLAESPVKIGPGGNYLDGRIYFASGSHLYSYQLPRE